MTNVRYCDTPTLKRIIEAGRAEGYNRAYEQGLEDALDPDGLHMVVLALTHEHKGGEPAEPHTRAQMYVKLRDTDKPEPIVIDMSNHDYEQMDSREINVSA